MGVSVQFGNFSGEKEEVSKSITDLTSAIDCQLVNTDILNPILKMTSGKVGYNYCIISTFGRKYFIEKYESIAGGHCLCYCHVDVLYTYADAIKELECLVLRNESISRWKRDETDAVIPVSNKRLVYGRNMSNTSIVKSTSDEYIVGIM